MMAAVPGKSARKLDVKFMAALGQGRDCGVCGKPFTAARKPRDFGEYVDPALRGVGVVYLLCRKCWRLPKPKQRAVISRDSRTVLERAYLRKTTAAGNA